MPAGGKNAMARHFLLSYAILWVHPWLRLPWAWTWPADSVPDPRLGNVGCRWAPRASFAVAQGSRSASASWVPLASMQGGQMPIAVGRIPWTSWMRSMGKNPNPSNPHRIDASFFYPPSRFGGALYAERLRWSRPQSFFCWLMEKLHPLYPSPRPPAWRMRAMCELSDNWGTFEGSAMNLCNSMPRLPWLDLTSAQGTHWS
jgi:hypothetical protein